MIAITGQTIETSHLYDVHLGETVVPYATLPPLKAVLPLKRPELDLPRDANGVGGVRIGTLERRMRTRWQTVSRLWEENKRPSNKMHLLENIDHFGKLSTQLQWKRNPHARPIRIVYTASGEPTAALLQEDESFVDFTLFWIACKDMAEAHYLLAIINSESLYDAVTPFMPKGQFGARHLQKQLWKLPIPEFDPTDPLHVAIANAGEAAAQGAAKQLDHLRQNRSRVTVTIARRELRQWLRESPEGHAVENAVARLLVEED